MKFFKVDEYKDNKIYTICKGRYIFTPSYMKNIPINPIYNDSAFQFIKDKNINK